MNGRVYDYNLGRFLSVDPYIQGISSQAINPYSYIQNNPLAGTDPSGYAASEHNCQVAFKSSCGEAGVASTADDPNDNETTNEGSGSDSTQTESTADSTTPTIKTGETTEVQVTATDEQTTELTDNAAGTADVGDTNAPYYKKPLVRVTVTKITIDSDLGIPHPETVDEQTTFGGVDGCCTFDGVEKTVEYNFEPRKPSDVLSISIDDVKIGVPVYRIVTEKYQYSPTNLCSSGSSCQNSRQPQTKPTGEWRTFQKIINFIKDMQPND